MKTHNPLIKVSWLKKVFCKHHNRIVIDSQYEADFDCYGGYTYEVLECLDCGRYIQGAIIGD